MQEDYEFTILYDLYEKTGKLDDSGNYEYKLKKKDCKGKWYVSDIQNITDIREIPNKQGIIYKSKCEVYHRPEAKWVMVKGSFDEVKQLLKADRKTVKGFYGSK